MVGQGTPTGIGVRQSWRDIMADQHRAVLYTNERIITDKPTLREGIWKIAHGTWRDFKLTNKSTAGKAVKLAASGLVVRGAVAQQLEAYTPLQWLFKGFG